MPRRYKGVSEAVVVALLIFLAIIVVAALWVFSQRFIGGGEVATARAVLSQNTYVGSPPNQIVTLSVKIDSKSDSPLFIREIRVICDRGGVLTTITPISQGIVAAPGTLPASTAVGGVTFGFAGDNYVRPRQTLEFAMTINFGTSYATSIQLVIGLNDPAGRTYYVTTNEVKLS